MYHDLTSRTGVKAFPFNNVPCAISSMGILIKELPCAGPGGLTDQVLSNELVNFLEIGAADGFQRKLHIK